MNSFDHCSACPIPGAERFLVDFNGKIWDRKKAWIVAQNNQSRQVRIVDNEGTIKFMRPHRLVAQCFCEQPEGADFVDHIDRDFTNDHYLNLRWVTRSQNNANRGLWSHNGTGVKHVHINTHGGWQVTIRKDGILHYFGTFHDFDLACKVAKEASIKVHGSYE
jgi:hypothetical protein